VSGGSVSGAMIRVDVVTENGTPLTETMETTGGLIPGAWWPADPGSVVEVMVAMRPEVLAAYPALPRTLRVVLTGLASPRYDERYPAPIDERYR
jgi:hypothetical protein